MNLSTFSDFRRVIASTTLLFSLVAFAFPFNAHAQTAPNGITVQGQLKNSAGVPYNALGLDFRISFWGDADYDTATDNSGGSLVNAGHQSAIISDINTDANGYFFINVTDLPAQFDASSHRFMQVEARLATSNDLTAFKVLDYAASNPLVDRKDASLMGAFAQTANYATTAGDAATVGGLDLASFYRESVANTAARDAITDAVAGTIVYVTSGSDAGVNFYDGSAWQVLGADNEAELTALTSQMTAAQADIVANATAAAAAQAAADAAQTDADAAIAAAAAAQATANTAQTAAITAQTTANTNATAITAANAAAAAAQATAAAAQADADTAIAAAAAAQADANTNAAAITAANTAAAAAQATAAAAQADADTAIAAAAAAQATANAAQTAAAANATAIAANATSIAANTTNITNNTSDINANTAAIAANDTDIAANAAAAAAAQTTANTANTTANTNSTNITALQSDMTQAQSDITALQNAVDGLTWLAPVTNFTDIATTYASPNTGDVVATTGSGEAYIYDGTNWELLIANFAINNATTTTAGIVKLAADGGTEAGTAVQANDSRLAQVATNTTEIANNANDIITANTNIATNASNITQNATDIAANGNAIATNTTAIANNTSEIAAVKAGITGFDVYTVAFE